jgi:sec-independent protein translocase protein TatA
MNNLQAVFSMPGHFEIIVILIIAILIFGRKLPEMIGNMGKGIRDFRKGLREDDETE